MWASTLTTTSTVWLPQQHPPVSFEEPTLTTAMPSEPSASSCAGEPVVAVAVAPELPAAASAPVFCASEPAVAAAAALELPAASSASAPRVASAASGSPAASCSNEAKGATMELEEDALWTLMRK